jgi:hypothetical protein
MVIRCLKKIGGSETADLSVRILYDKKNIIIKKWKIELYYFPF